MIRVLPPLRPAELWKQEEDFEFLPPLDEMIHKTDLHEHVCGVGSAPKGERRIRRCQCGTFYHYSRGLWRPMGTFSLWWHKNEL